MMILANKKWHGYTFWQRNKNLLLLCWEFGPRLAPMVWLKKSTGQKTFH